MQYTGYANDPKVDMAAKERIYQHTMGSRTGVVFNDLKFLNVYNDCMCKSGATCQNGGFPHPRKCNQCICAMASVALPVLTANKERAMLRKDAVRR